MLLGDASAHGSYFIHAGHREWSEEHCGTLAADCDDGDSTKKNNICYRNTNQGVGW